MAEAAPSVQPPARFPWVELLAGLPCAIVPALLSVTGYGAYLRNGFFMAIPALVMLSFVPLSLFRVVLKPRTPPRNAALLFIFLGFTLLSWASGRQLRRWHCEAVCSRAAPAIETLQKYRTDHGSYPARLQDMPEFRRLAEAGRVSIAEGRFCRDGWDVGALEQSDMTVYLQPDNFCCVVPLERKLLMSISRFYILRKDSTASGWSEDHIIWTWSVR